MSDLPKTDSPSDASSGSMVKSAGKWEPLSRMLHGKVIKPFLPLDKHPSLKLTAPFYRNLYYGDEVFLFESLGDKWGRGYLIVQPLPEDFIEKSSDLEKLPELKVNIVIVPLRFIQNIGEFPLASTFAPPSENDFEHSGSQVPSVYQVERRSKDLEANGSEVRLKPPLPLIRLDSGDFLDELIPSLNQLSSHIFSLYSVAEYELYVKLYQLFERLYGLRLQLYRDLLTKRETSEVKKQISVILTNISKLLSSKGTNKFSKVSNSLKSDPSGFETIRARDVHTAELYDYQNLDLSKRPIPKFIAGNQIASALQPNFPIQCSLEADMTPSKKSKFEKVTPSQILVDFRDVSGTSTLNPKGFIGMTVYLYLRTPKKRLTEAFAIHINHANDFNLERVSAALFRNIPGTEVLNSRIYLVAIITERIQSPFNNTSADVLNYYRKGIAAGCADITRVFSRKEGSLKAGESHDFRIKLFGSYVNAQDNTQLDPANQNFGWGDLIDRIIKGSKNGVAVNPRAERLVLSIKEFKDDLSNVESVFESSIKTPVNQIRTCFFDPLVRAHDRVYFTIGKVNLVDVAGFPGELISMKLTNDDPESEVEISKATNEDFGTLWNFTSVYSNEVVGETIKFSNFHQVKDNESLTLKLYVNGEYKSQMAIPVVVKGHIHEFSKNSLLSFTDQQGKKYATVEVTSEYVGKTFNILPCFIHILNYERIYNLPQDEEKLIDTLRVLNQTNLTELIKFFKPLISKLLHIFSLAHSLDLSKLKSAVYYAFIHLLDVVIARDEQYTYLYHEFITEIGDYHLPQVGLQLLSITTNCYENVKNEWNFVGRTLCRIIPLLIRISTFMIPSSALPQFQSHFRALVDSLTAFMNLEVERNLADQLVILEHFDLLMNGLYDGKFFNAEEVIDIVIGFVDSLRVGDKSQSEEHGTVAAASNGSATLKPRSSKIQISKLLLIRRILNSWVFESFESLPESSIKYYYYATNWTLETYELFGENVEVLRLANSCLVSNCNIAWHIIAHSQKQNYVLPVNISRAILRIAEIFGGLHHFLRTKHHFEPKRTYTQVFPNSYPFNDLIIDSLVNETVLVEVLVELGVVYSFMTKIAKGILVTTTEKGKKHQGFLSIIEMSANDDLFNSSDNYVKSFSKDDLLTLIQMNRLLTQSSFFPHTKWISLYALFIESVTASSELIQSLMISQFIPPPEQSNTFDRALWSKFFKSVLDMAASMPAAICHLSEVPRKTAYKITGDVRRRCALVLGKCWDSLGWESLERDYVRFQLKKMGGYQAEFIQEDYGIIEELVVFCLQRHSQAQVIGVRILWSIIVAELLIQESIDHEEDEELENKLILIERECLLGLDKFYKSNRYIPGLYEQGNFITRFKLIARLDPEDVSFKEVYSFIANLAEFLEIQYDLSTVPSGEMFDDERTFHQLDITRHLMRVHNAKRFYASLDDLFITNIEKQNFIQAALCLELMASTVEWNVSEILPHLVKPHFPSQSAFERKEALYKDIGHYLIKGKKYEKAVLIYRELAEAYDRYQPNLKGLSFAHSQISKLFELLDTADRETPTYFKVTFIGLGFPSTLTSRSFIYEGHPFEHITSIHTRLLRLHTGAKIITDDDPMLKAHSKSPPPPGKFLHISTVKPQMDVNHSTGNLTTAERLYAENKSLKYFSTSRRLTKSDSVLNLWVEETTYETYSYFPTLMNRSDIAETTSIKLSPIQNALRTLSDKIRDLVNLEASAQSALNAHDLDGFSFSTLSRNLSGTVDSPVNGGIAQYKEFFNQEVNFEDEGELMEYENDLLLLRNSFDNLAICTYRCLLIEGKVLPFTFVDAHRSMISLFAKNFDEEIQRTGLSIADLESSIIIRRDISSSSSANSSLRKVPSNSSASQYTEAASLNPSMNRFQTSPSVHKIASNSGGSIFPINRTVSGLSDQASSRMSLGTNATGNTKISSGKSKRSLLNWRQSKIPNNVVQ